MGLLRVDVPTLTRINSLGEITLATLHSMQQVRPGQNLAGTRVVPLLIEESKIVALEQLVSRPVVEVLPLQKFKVGIVTTGSEVYTGRIKDAFGPVLRDKFARLECTVMDQVFTSDEVEMTSSAISGFIRQGADMVVVTGGMSVDPDDKTPASIRAAGAQVVSYGAPVYPGAMFLLGYVPTERGRVPVLGLPGCVMYYKASIFELVVPRLLAGLEVTAEDIAGMGHGASAPAVANAVIPSVRLENRRRGSDRLNLQAVSRVAYGNENACGQWYSPVRSWWIPTLFSLTCCATSCRSPASRSVAVRASVVPVP